MFVVQDLEGNVARVGGQTGMAYVHKVNPIVIKHLHLVDILTRTDIVLSYASMHVFLAEPYVPCKIQNQQLSLNVSKLRYCLVELYYRFSQITMF